LTRSVICLFWVHYGMFDVRATQPEFLDSKDCDPQLAYSSYRFMKWVNRFGGGTKAVKNYLATEISRNGDSRPVRILDIGSGTCDIPLAILKWARKRRQEIEFTCLETNETALKFASENIERSGFDAIELKRQSIFEFDCRQSFDYAIGSMFFHHCRDEQILDLIEKLRSYMLKSLLINDLRRDLTSYASCRVLACSFSKGLRHDVLLSIRKGFKSEELSRLLGRIKGAQVEVKTYGHSRLAAVIRFRQRG
jgi:2-polyprenyl-3-methyl-5-hydroxy-6-metoxy-1,4-benzoquinol methylase